jgi:putative FmdB family regulatory protein
MPTYEYRCPSGHQFERFQKITDEPEAECPTCGAPSERMLSGGAGFLLKGGGFYATDYRSESYKKEASKEASGRDGADTSETTSSKEEKEGKKPSPKDDSNPTLPSTEG